MEKGPASFWYGCGRAAKRTLLKKGGPATTATTFAKGVKGGLRKDLLLSYGSHRNGELTLNGGKELKEEEEFKEAILAFGEIRSSLSKGDYLAPLSLIREERGI